MIDQYGYSSNNSFDEEQNRWTTSKPRLVFMTNVLGTKNRVRNSTNKIYQEYLSWINLCRTRFGRTGVADLEKPAGIYQTGIRKTGAFDNFARFCECSTNTSSHLSWLFDGRPGAENERRQILSWT
jgi:hypothetical protein